MAQTTSTLTFRDLEIDDYEKVVEIRNEEVGLHAIIAIHNTALGPALGGIRAYPYKTFDDALTDVLRLSKGMTYKSAVSETGTGGGKSVIITDGKGHKTDLLLYAFAEAVNAFEGNYICAEDIGMSVADLEIVAQKTRYAVGLPHPKSSGDPSPFTSRGGYRGIQAVCQKLWGTDSVKGRTIAIQGLGSVGMKLASYLFWEGAKLIVADIDKTRTEQAAKLFGAKVVSSSEILSVECDILSPCAMGGILNPQTIPSLRCEAVAGLANNQLLTDEDGVELQNRGILYAPDYVINAGGLMNVCIEIEDKGYNPVIARTHIDRIYDLLLNIFNEAEMKNRPTSQVAAEIAESNLKTMKGKRSKNVVFHH